MLKIIYGACTRRQIFCCDFSRTCVYNIVSGYTEVLLTFPFDGKIGVFKAQNSTENNKYFNSKCRSYENNLTKFTTGATIFDTGKKGVAAISNASI